MHPEKSNLTSLSDRHGRSVNYLRLSITDRCNLACLYCSDTSRQNFIPHEKILRYEQFKKLVEAACQLGIKKVRITGGEPFARRGCLNFLKSLRNDFPGLRLAITSNATLIEPYINELASLGLSSINISLDSFRPESFLRITGKDLHATVLNNIDKLLAAGQKVKLNAVLLKGISDNEADDFVHAVRSLPIDLRFIEFMPMGSRTQWSDTNFLSAAEMRARLSGRLDLEPVQKDEKNGLDGPARMFQARGARGRIGFITALTDHFCSQCNRLRITSDGKLRTCLFSDQETDLSGALSDKNGDSEQVRELLRKSALEKPLGEKLLEACGKAAVARKGMAGIGG